MEPSLNQETNVDAEYIISYDHFISPIDTEATNNHSGIQQQVSRVIGVCKTNPHRQGGAVRCGVGWYPQSVCEYL